MKILICPDIHGRHFWKKPNIEDFDKVIFLGDYLDNYDGETNTEGELEVQITLDSSIKNFEEIIQLAKDNSDKVVLLLGNHDLPYFSKEYGRALNYWCRHDYKNHDKIAKLFNDNKDLFKIAWECENKKMKRVLFTHAGVTKDFQQICGLSAETINTYFLNESSGDIPNIVGLAAVSFYRGGYQKFGSPVWADVREHISDPVTDVYQIFGHTYCKDAIITENFAMLDRGDSCYVLEEDKLYKWKP